MRLSYFQFLPLSDFPHLKSANIKIASSIFPFINSDLLLTLSNQIYHKRIKKSTVRKKLRKSIGRREVLTFEPVKNRAKPKKRYSKSQEAVI